MDGLAQFLRVRLDDDERSAREAVAGPWVRHPKVIGVHADDAAPGEMFGTGVADCRRLPRATSEVKQATADYIARHDPSRVLAEVVAKRRIVEEHKPAVPRALPNRERGCLTCSTAQYWDAEANEANCLTLCLLALSYADHADYREEWQP